MFETNVSFFLNKYNAKIKMQPINKVGTWYRNSHSISCSQVRSCVKLLLDYNCNHGRFPFLRETKIRR